MTPRGGLAPGGKISPPRRPYDALQASGFVGCADGPEDLASGYKAALRRGLESKTGKAGNKATNKKKAKPRP